MSKDITIKIEIGINLLDAIQEIIDNVHCSEIGVQLQKAFGINFTKIVDNKFIELKKSKTTSSETPSSKTTSSETPSSETTSSETPSSETTLSEKRYKMWTTNL